MNMLGAYLDIIAREPWNYGDKPGVKRDCCTLLADWCIFVGYPDPMADIRGAYASEAEALDLVKERGLLKLATRAFDRIGLQRTKDFMCGDVAILRRPMVDGSDAVCAIRSGKRWVMLHERGLIVDGEAGDPVRGWRVEWARP